MSDFSRETLDGIESLVERAHVPFHLGNKLYFTIPADAALDIQDLAKDQPNPVRKAGVARLRDIESLIDFVSRHLGVGTEIYIDELRVTAFLNGHAGTPGNAGWGDFTATFEPRYTPGWSAWTGFAGKWIDQRSFAEFLENRIPEIAQPDGADVLQAVAQLRIKYDVTFERLIETSNDLMQLVYREDAEAGNIRIPTRLDLWLPMFEGGESYALSAKLRFTKPNQNGQVQFRIDLGEEVHTIMTEARKDIQDKLRQALPETPVFIGTWAGAQR